MSFNSYLLIFYLTINFVCSNTDLKKTWNDHPTTNLEPDQPNFGPFPSQLITKQKQNINTDVTEPVLKNFQPKVHEIVSSNPLNFDPEEIQELGLLNGSNDGDPSEDVLSEKMRPFKKIVMEMYKNYKKTFAEEQEKEQQKEKEVIEKKTVDNDDEEEEKIDDVTIETFDDAEKSEWEPKVQPQLKNHTKDHKKKLMKKFINLGPGVNISLDLPSEMVHVQLDEECLKDVFTGKSKKSHSM